MNKERRRLNSRAPERLVKTAHCVRKHPRLVLPFLRLRRWRRHRGNNFEIGVISNSSPKNAKFRHCSHRWNPGKSPGKVGESRERLWRHQPAEAKVAKVAQPNEGASRSPVRTKQRSISVCIVRIKRKTPTAPLQIQGSILRGIFKCAFVLWLARATLARCPDFV